MKFWATTFLCLATPLAADLHMEFREGAPKDRFILTNHAACAIRNTDVVLDLQPSAGKLVFDVTGAGAGVEVFQPFELTSGAGALNDLPKVADGDQVLMLNLGTLPPGGVVAFTIDVDDTIGAREITVAGSEIAGAELRHDGKSAAFGTDATARLDGIGCTS